MSSCEAMVMSLKSRGDTGRKSSTQHKKPPVKTGIDCLPSRAEMQGFAKQSLVFAHINSV